MRKVAIWALCLIVVSPKKHFSNLSESLRKQLEFFKDEIDNKNPFGGKIQLNPIPEIVKRMINKDSNVISRLRADGYQLDIDQRIWTFPRFESSVPSTVSQLTGGRQCLSKTQQYAGSNTLMERKNLAKYSLRQVCDILPDPIDYCIGIFLPEYEEKSPIRDQ